MNSHEEQGSWVTPGGSHLAPVEVVKSHLDRCLSDDPGLSTFRVPLRPTLKTFWLFFRSAVPAEINLPAHLVD